MHPVTSFSPACGRWIQRFHAPIIFGLRLAEPACCVCAIQGVLRQELRPEIREESLGWWRLRRVIKSIRESNSQAAYDFGRPIAKRFFTALTYITPCDKARISRRYRGDSLILETRFITTEGTVLLVDFMPLCGGHSTIVRLLIGESGQVAMSTELVLRFGYGAIVPWVTRLEDGTLRAVAGPDMASL